MDLGDLLEPRDVVFGLRGSDIGSVAAALLRETLPRRGFGSEDIERLVGAVIRREQETPTICGPIAIPHARDAKLSSFVAGVAINANGVPDPAPRVIIAFLSPETRRSEHLAFLASLARLSRDADMVDSIAAATSAEEVVAIIRREKR